MKLKTTLVSMKAGPVCLHYTRFIVYIYSHIAMLNISLINEHKKQSKCVLVHFFRP